MQACDIELADGKRAVTTLRASRTAGKPRTGTLDRVGERGIDNLNQVAVAQRKWRIDGNRHWLNGRTNRSVEGISEKRLKRQAARAEVDVG